MTIYALSTVFGTSGIAVIRISGAGTLDALSALGMQAPPLPRMATLHAFRDESGELIDRGIVLFFPNPQSFTGEDVAELHLHGGPAVIEKMLSTLGGMPGLRMAEPGEFSRIAFRHNKMDLTVAEGIADLIHAETEMQRKQALRQAEGWLHTTYEDWRSRILTALAHLEAYIDFPEEDIPDDVYQKLQNEIKALSHDITSHLAAPPTGEAIRDGISLAIIGPPNAGKSSLLNALAQRDVAIVSETAGTTRDVIEVRLNIGGMVVTASDTAGLRSANDEIEKEGIRRAEARAAQADIILLVVDGSDWEAQLPIIKQWQDQADFILANKMDITLSDKEIHGHVTGTGSGKAGAKILPLSVKTGEKLGTLLANIEQKIKADFSTASAPLITRARHREQLHRAAEALQHFAEADALEFQCEELRDAAKAIGEITGHISVDEILDTVFHSFCIGK